MVGGDQWPIFLYANYVYDPEDAWIGLFCTAILISVRACLPLYLWQLDYQIEGEGYKHVFTSLSLVDKSMKAMRSGNA